MSRFQVSNCRKKEKIVEKTEIRLWLKVHSDHFSLIYWMVRDIENIGIFERHLVKSSHC